MWEKTASQSLAEEVRWERHRYLSWQVGDKSTSEGERQEGGVGVLQGSRQGTIWADGLQLSSGSLGSLSGNLNVDGSDMVWLERAQHRVHLVLDLLVLGLGYAVQVCILKGSYVADVDELEWSRLDDLRGDKVGRSCEVWGCWGQGDGEIRV